MVIKIHPQQVVDIDKIVLDPTNPNKMSDKDFSALKEEFKEYGFLYPLIVNKDYKIADGEHRWKAMKELGMKQISVIKIDVTDISAKMLRQILNKLSGIHDEALDAQDFQIIFDAGQEQLDRLKEFLPSEKNHIDKLLKGIHGAPKPQISFKVNQFVCPKCQHTGVKKDFVSKLETDSAEKL